MIPLPSFLVAAAEVYDCPGIGEFRVVPLMTWRAWRLAVQPSSMDPRGCIGDHGRWVRYPTLDMQEGSADLWGDR